jgi:hypothetical protein
MDSRDADRTVDRAENQYLGEVVHSEKCERCSRQMETVYYFRGRKLCSTCLEEERRGDGGFSSDKPPLTPIKITVKNFQKAALVEFLESLIGNLLNRIGIRFKSKKSTVIARAKSELEAENEEGKKRPPPPTMLAAAKPLHESSLSKEKHEEMEFEKEPEPVAPSSAREQESKKTVPLHTTECTGLVESSITTINTKYREGPPADKKPTKKLHSALLDVVPDSEKKLAKQKTTKAKSARSKKPRKKK